MKKHLINSWALFAFASLSVACGGPKQYTILGSSRDPGAEGKIQVERIEGNNNLVTIELKHLAPPERLGNNAKAYVMWFKTPAGQTTLASAMAYNASDRVARATATTPYPEFTVSVTAEASEQVTTPSSIVIIEQKITK